MVIYKIVSLSNIGCAWWDILPIIKKKDQRVI